MMTVSGFNALQIILASGFTGVTDLGHIPAHVLALASLPELVTLVRANEGVNFKLAAKTTDPVRSDTTIFRWFVELAPSVIQTPDYFLSGSQEGTFQLLKKISAHAKYPSLEFVRLPIKFVAGSDSKSGEPELWLRTVVFHNEESVVSHIRKGVLVGA